MDRGPELNNPAIPSSLALPRALPRLSRTERSQALQQLSAKRASLFAVCLLMLFLPAYILGDPVQWWPPNRAAVALELSFLLFVRIVTSSRKKEQVGNWGSFACIALQATLLLGCLPVSADPAHLREAVFGSLVLSGAILLSRPAFLLSLLLCAGFALGLPTASPLVGWHFAALALIATLIQKTQLDLSRSYNEVALMDEARYAAYLQAAEAARKSQHRFEKLSNAAREALILHAEGVVIHANAAAHELFGLADTNLSGRPMADLLAGNSARVCSGISDGKTAALSRIGIRVANGNIREVLAYSYELVFPDGPISVLGLRAIDRKAELGLRPCECADENILN